MKPFLSLTVCIFFSVYANNLFAQCAPLPDLFMSKKEGSELRDEFVKDRLFRKSKFTRLRAITTVKPVPLNFEYRWRAFRNLVGRVEGYDSMRVHFAVYHECNIADFPRVETGSLILLFSPEVDRANPQQYFFMAANDDNIYPVPDKCAASWIENFEINIQAELRKTINSNDPDNMDGTVGDGFSDTKSSCYSKADFENAFIIEQEYQTAHHEPITAIKVSLSAYSKYGKIIKPRDPDQICKYRRRLMIQFDYMKLDPTSGTNVVFNLEEQGDFACRADSRLEIIGNLKFTKDELQKLSVKEKLHILSIDNGQLCPTHCP